MGRRDGRIRLTSEEQDALTSWRRIVAWGQGDVGQVKRRHNKRVRRLSKHELRDERVW